jgi:hypothetical protein
LFSWFLRTGQAIGNVMSCWLLVSEQEVQMQSQAEALLPVLRVAFCLPKRLPNLKLTDA